MIDCMIVGFNAVDPNELVSLLRLGGKSSVGYRDANLTFVEHGGVVHTSMSLVDQYCGVRQPGTPELSNADFLWPAITTIGTHLHRKGHSFDYVRLFQADRDKLAGALDAGQVRLVAITTTVYVSPQPITEIVRFVRARGVGVPIVIGGPAVAGWPKLHQGAELQRFMMELGADYYVFSAEGEATLAKLIDALKKQSPESNALVDSQALCDEVSRIANLAYRDGDGYVVNASETEDNALESNMTRYELFPSRHFGEFVTVRTAKSCPFACSFCGFPERAGAYRYLSVDKVRDELRAVQAIGGVTTVTFIDDTFNVPKARFKDMLRMMIDERFGFRWNSYLRSDHVDDEALELMAASGCEGVFLGAESGSTRILEAMNKRSRPQHYATVIRRCRELGIVTYASLIVGFPGETAATVEETVDFLEDAQPDFFRAQPWYADPLTPVFRDGKAHRLEGEGFDWTHSTMDCTEAMDHVERMFLSVSSSVWLPQNDFELWSVFYLQRKGMSLARIKHVLRLINGAIRKKLLLPDRDELSPREFQQLTLALADAERSDQHPCIVTAESVKDTLGAWQGRGAPASVGGLVKQAQQWDGTFTAATIESRSAGEPSLLPVAGAIVWRLLAEETDLDSMLLPFVAFQGDSEAVHALVLDRERHPDTESATRAIRDAPQASQVCGETILYLHNRPVVQRALHTRMPRIAFGCASTDQHAGEPLLARLRSRYPRDLHGLDLLLAESPIAGGMRLDLEYANGVYAREDLVDIVRVLRAQLSFGPAGSKMDVPTTSRIPSAANFGFS